MKLKIVTHFTTDDPEFCADYYDIELFDESDELVTEFGDYYHDRGDDKVEGFIEGAEWALGEKIEVERINVADREDY